MVSSPNCSTASTWAGMPDSAIVIWSGLIPNKYGLSKYKLEFLICLAVSFLNQTIFCSTPSSLAPILSPSWINSDLMMFICGEPKKVATNKLAGSSNNVTGASAC